MTISISILDQSPIYPGSTAAEALAQTIRLAQKAEELGYRRFWVSEHHDSEFLAGSSPEVLISHLLAKTERIRVGSGGIMLQHYSPYKVAENFNVLASLAPGRVDLGVGRAPGGLPRSTQALQHGVTAPQSLTEKLVELEAYVNNQIPEDHPLSGIRVTPVASIPADIYLLGASLDSAQLAASLGLPYVFSLSINGDRSVAIEAIQAYRASFQRVSNRTAKALLALPVIVAETDQEAHAFAVEQKHYKVYLASGRKATVGTLEQAEEFGRQAKESYTIEEKTTEVTRGSKETVREQLLDLQRRTGVDEFIVTTRIEDFSERLRSYERLAEALSGIEAAI
ncbi:LLM class flavin-dependent oxidoreductase [Paenibacillus whitsoniae]|uniref:LLM class flavin-dependent oxidoreductase n=1 Tax=Paenibacillus whitsoniae TaxID=2496558 RepID=A0A3S0BX19_9BACL|nr:LLM class flavin-dependent oxidoreductase [Paenibacillus whitsoniae]RTE10238.1 LLM class flavin-dependent oxidoreductase [Paenibacillus whitsoniae]